MTTYPGSPKLTKGAIIGLDPMNPIASVIVFQYNPKTLTRSVGARTSTAEDARTEVLRLEGAPTETITIGELEIDAADQLEVSDPIAATMGIHPQLSALEMLLYPKSAHVIANTALLAAGTIEVVPPEAPLTLFVWGSKRVLPVRLTSVTITEQEYSPELDPIRATVSLTLRVLTYNDFPVGHPGHALFLAHQVVKEVMASIGGATSATGAASVPVSP